MTWYRNGEKMGSGGTDVNLAFFMLDAVSRKGGEGADDWYRAFERYIDDTYEPHEILRMCSDDDVDYDIMFLDWVQDSISKSREAFAERFGFEWRDDRWTE